MNEKRKYMRFNFSLKGRLVCDDRGGLATEIELIDISREGLKIRLPQSAFLRTDTPKLELYLPNRELPIVMEGSTRWTRPKGSKCYIGMKIEKIDPAEKSELLEYAYGRWKEQT
ncbi:MAG: PilZ domain-containing protein [Candidatus Omnitrophica bacterium]|nr:PilZ domain-containing protein [Candidatus Omnitrophota bacterium]